MSRSQLRNGGRGNSLASASPGVALATDAEGGMPVD